MGRLVPVGLVALTAVFVAVFPMRAVLPVMAVFSVVMAGLGLGFVPVAMLSMTLVAVLSVGAVVVTVFAVAMRGMRSVAAGPVPMTVSSVAVVPVTVFRIKHRPWQPDHQQQHNGGCVQSRCVIEHVVVVDVVEPCGNQRRSSA